MPTQAAIFMTLSLTTRTRKTSIRLAWNEETPGEAPGYATTLLAPVAEETSGIRLLNGTTQVQFLPGAPLFPDNVQSSMSGC